MKATTEILRTYIGGTLLIVEKTLAEPVSQVEMSALFALRKACIEAEAAMTRSPDTVLTPEQAEFLSRGILDCIKLCAGIDINSGTNVAIQ